MKAGFETGHGNNKNKPKKRKTDHDDDTSSTRRSCLRLQQRHNHGAVNLSSSTSTRSANNNINKEEQQQSCVLFPTKSRSGSIDGTTRVRRLLCNDEVSNNINNFQRLHSNERLRQYSPSTQTIIEQTTLVIAHGYRRGISITEQSDKISKVRGGCILFEEGCKY